MKILTIIVRILLGLVFVVFGSNGFLQFLPMPPLPHNITGDFLHAFFASHYVYAVAACQVIGGFIPNPRPLRAARPHHPRTVIVNIVLFHIFLAAEGLPLALVIAALFVFLLWRYWAAFAAILRAVTAARYAFWKHTKLARRTAAPRNCSPSTHSQRGHSLT